MVELSQDSDVYTTKRLKQKLKEHYKEYIFFATVERQDNVVCFKNMAEYRYVITQKWQSSKRDDTNSAECEAESIITMAAKIIRDEIGEREYDQSSYPTNEDIANIEKGKQWIPHHLHTLLKIIVFQK